VYAFDFEPSIVPGWHTTIYPKEFLWSSIIVIIALFAATAIWQASNNVDKSN
jgi:hypothetical protein